MSLMFDETHKKIDTRELKNKNRKKISASVGSLVLSLTLLSGCGKTDKVNNEVSNNPIDNSQSISDTVEEKIPSEVEYESIVNVEEHKPNEKFVIPENIMYILMNDGNYYYEDKISYKDLGNVSEIALYLDGDTDCFYLNYMSNLKTLNITEKTSNSKMIGVSGSRLPEGVNISFDYLGDYGSELFDYSKFPFLKDMKNMSSLTVGNITTYDLGSQYINDLDVDNLCLKINNCSNISNLDFKNIKTLTIIGEPYDITMFVSRQDIEKLEGSSIEVKIIDNDDNDIKNKVIEISDRLDSIYNSLSINDNNQQMDKLDKILSYLLCSYEYDPTVMNMSDYEAKRHPDFTYAFYEEGELYGAMEKDTQICGNYAAMTKALCNRAGLDCYFLASEDHAWNAIEIGDYYYFVDSTWLDLVNVRLEIHELTSGNQEKITYQNQKAEDVFPDGSIEDKAKFTWYLEDPTEHPDREGHHILSVEPYGLELVDVPDDVRNKELGIMVEESTPKETVPVTTEAKVEHTESISDKKYIVTLSSGKKYIVPGAVLLGIFSALGMGVLVHKKKELERKKRREELNRRISIDDFEATDSWDFSTSFDDYRRKYK